MEEGYEQIKTEVYASGRDLEPEQFPQLYTFSAGLFFYKFTPVAEQPASAEIIFVPTNRYKHLELVGVLAE